jgi:hypothetical protein
MKVCPNCKKYILVDLSCSEGILYCPDPKCGYIDDRLNQMRDIRDRILNDPDLFEKYKMLIQKLLEKESIEKILESV